MNSPVGVGIIGCGNISPAYLNLARAFPVLSIRALADIDPVVAAARGAQFDIPAMSVEQLLADSQIEVIVNLTVPQSHVPVGLRALAAGKHLYSEKPLGVNTAQARELLAAAKAADLRVGCAPANFLGPAHQACRRHIDEGAIGSPLGGTAFFMCPGHERWHPSPAFYYQEGGGPMLDMGPYYLTALVNLLGPVARVAAMATRPRHTRTVSSEPLRGTIVPVNVDTHVAGTLQFRSGAVVSLTMSFDVPKHGHSPLELYGTEGAMLLPDPDSFGGQIHHATAGSEWSVIGGEMLRMERDYRILGVAELSAAIRSGEPHRASGELALHVLEVIEAFERSSSGGCHVDIISAPPRPAPFTSDCLQ